MMNNCDNCIFRGQWCEEENKCPLFKEAPESEEEGEDKSENLYHLYCEKCGWDWWSFEAFPDKCPNCKCDRT